MVPSALAMHRAAITDLLQRWNDGDPQAADQIASLIYDELHAIAAGYFRRERREHTLQATALVHEAWVRLIEHPGVEWRDRGHFVAIAARVMRQVLVDHSRRHGALKRGAGAQHMTLAEAAEVAAGRPPNLVELDEALQELEALDPEKGKLVELRFFGGLSIEETAQHLGLSTATVNRRWRRARNWLYRRLQPKDLAPASGPSP